MTSSAYQSSAQNRAFYPGLDIRLQTDPMDFHYGAGVFGPRPEYRSLNAIRASLRNPDSTGPDPVYAIAMDVGCVDDREELNRRMLLFGLVMYAKGKLGDEPVRSQGHVHAIAPHCGWSTPELFEIWQGRAIVYGQERSSDDPGRCIAVTARPGDHVVMPPGWAHCVVNADADSPLIFGAWCDRQYSFDYVQVRAHHGLAWFPLVAADGTIRWEPNPRYFPSRLESREARAYSELGLATSMPIYTHFRADPESIQWVSDPARRREFWQRFEP